MVRGILGNHESPMLHLTFDDGPDPLWTPAVLDALAAARATATFFVLGERAAAWPWVVERILAAGHGVEVHGHGHLRHPLTRRECVEGDLEAALAVLRVHGVVPRLWRGPRGGGGPLSAGGGGGARPPPPGGGPGPPHPRRPSAAGGGFGPQP